MSESKGRFQYIKRGIVGMAAATLLTGVVAAPAFAATGFTDATTTGTTSTTKNEAKTEIKAETGDIQISATVPTTVTAAVDSNGDLTFPDATAFKISVAAGSWAVKVSDVSVTAEQGYTLATSAAVDQANNLYLALNNGTADVALKATGNADAVSNLAQDTSGASDMGVTMKGKVFGMSYTDAFAGKKMVALNWTLAAK